MNGRIEVLCLNKEGYSVGGTRELVSEHNIDDIIKEAKLALRKKGLSVKHWNNGNINLRGEYNGIPRRTIIVNYYSPKFLEQKKVKLN